MDLGIDGRVAMVLGAGGGLGGGVALALAREGASVGAVDIDPDGLDATVQEAKAEGRSISSANLLDLTDLEAVDEVHAAIERELGPVSILINITGGPPPASGAGLRLLVGWSKTLANEVAIDGVTANVIVPGRIATDRVRRLDEAKAEREGHPVAEVSAAREGKIPVGHYGRVEEYADTVTFISSSRASFINRSEIRIDGGMIASSRSACTSERAS